jgi:hypothetical protein
MHQDLSILGKEFKKEKGSEIKKERTSNIFFNSGKFGENFGINIMDNLLFTKTDKTIEEFRNFRDLQFTIPEIGPSASGSIKKAACPIRRMFYQHVCRRQFIFSI